MFISETQSSFQNISPRMKVIGSTVLSLLICGVGEHSWTQEQAWVWHPITLYPVYKDSSLTPWSWLAQLHHTLKWETVILWVNGRGQLLPFYDQLEAHRKVAAQAHKILCWQHLMQMKLSTLRFFFSCILVSSFISVLLLGGPQVPKWQAWQKEKDVERVHLCPWI